jgi:hypothetical protein
LSFLLQETEKHLARHIATENKKQEFVSQEEEGDGCVAAASALDRMVPGAIPVTGCSLALFSFLPQSLPTHLQWVENQCPFAPAWISHLGPGEQCWPRVQRVTDYTKVNTAIATIITTAKINC